MVRSLPAATSSSHSLPTPDDEQAARRPRSHRFRSPQPHKSTSITSPWNDTLSPMPSQLPILQPGRRTTDMSVDIDPDLQPEPATRGLLRAIRKWYHRHLAIADALIASGVVLLNLLMMFLNSKGPDADPNATLHLPITLSALGLGGTALALRRRCPVWVWAALLLISEIYLLIQKYALHLEMQQRASMSVGVLLIPALAMPICLGTLASHRRASVAWTAWAVNLIVSTCDSFLLEPSYSFMQFGQNMLITGLVTAVGVLVGVNTRSVRLRIKALEARSARMALAREQGALLAAAEERSRIARENYEIGRASCRERV